MQRSDMTDWAQAVPERPRRLRRAALLGLAALVLALVGAGCGSDGSDDDGSRAARGGTLRISTPAFPSTLDPLAAGGSGSIYVDLAYDPLIVKAPDGSFQPGLAVSWKAGPQNRSFDITLRKGVRFSDGQPLDAAAVKTWLNYALKAPGSAAPLYLGALETIDVTGPLTLTLRFSAPTPSLELVFSQVLKMGYIPSPKAIKAKTLGTATAGAGRYILDKSETVARDHYTYVPNPNYWDKDAISWDKVVVRSIVNPNAALQALKTDQVQVVLDQPASSLDAAKAAGLRSAAPLSLLIALAINDRHGTTTTPLGDARVRQALNYAVDREAITNALAAGSGRVANQMALPGDDSFDPALEDRYPYDLDKAKQLLAEAGYADGFTMKVLSVANVGQDVLVQALVGQWAKIGVKLDVDIKPDFGAWATASLSTKYSATTIAWGRIPAVMNYQLLWGPVGNPFKASEEQFDRLYEELTAASPAETNEIARQMQRFMVEQAWYVPVTATPVVVLHSSDVAGVDTSARRPYPYPVEFHPAN